MRKKAWKAYAGALEEENDVLREAVEDLEDQIVGLTTVWEEALSKLTSCEDDLRAIRSIVTPPTREPGDTDALLEEYFSQFEGDDFDCV